MKMKFLIIPALAASLMAMPITDASAYGRGGYGGYHHGGPGWGLIAGVGALVGAAALLVTYPVRAVVEAAPPAYAPPPAQVAYAPPPQAYYAPPPAYYAAPPVYYQPRGYYRAYPY